MNTEAAVRIANSVQVFPLLLIYLEWIQSGLPLLILFSKEPSVIVTVLCDLGIKYLSKVYLDMYLCMKTAELYEHITKSYNLQFIL